MRLAGRVAWVTGAGRNIGRAIAHSLAEAGADLVVTSRTRDDVEKVACEIERAGRRALRAPLDVRDPDAISAVVQKAGANFGPIDILINNAAVLSHLPFETLTYSAWREAVSVILDGAFLCTQAVLPGMLKYGSGSIINIIGTAAHTGSKGHGHIAAAKAGLAGLTKSLAVEYAGRGITVNGVSPGMVSVERPDESSAAREKRLAPLVPAGRLGFPTEVASLCLYLASQEARYITGQIVPINGGVYT
jgi:3-oxoacyl-[acyl-carrier protein] reductase